MATRSTGKFHPFRLTAFDKAEIRQLGLDPDKISDVQKWLKHRHEMLRELYADTTQRNRRNAGPAYGITSLAVNAKPGFGHLEPKSKGYGARLPSVRAGTSNPRMYHVIVINERTGQKTYMTSTPVTHHEGVTILSKIAPHRLTRKQLEEVPSVRAGKANPVRFPVGSRVTTVNVRLRSGKVITGVFTVIGWYQGSREIRNAKGDIYMLPATHLRNAKNALAPGQSVPVAAVTYIDKKKGDKNPVPYEHEFEGSKKPRLYFDGKNLEMKRAGSKYAVKRDSDGDYWIHD